MAKKNGTKLEDVKQMTSKAEEPKRIKVKFMELSIPLRVIIVFSWFLFSMWAWSLIIMFSRMW